MANDEDLALVPDDSTTQEKPLKCDLEFVNVGAISQAEKERNQRIVRSTAAKSVRRRQLSEKSIHGESGTKGATKPKSRHPKPRQGSKADPPTLAHELSLESSSAGSRSFNKGRADSFAFANSVQNGSPSTQSSRPPSVVTSPITPLGAGRVDPFMPVETVDHINELIDHSVTHLWPGLHPRRLNGTASNISSAWLEKVYARPVVLHALLFGASVHIDVLRSPRLSLPNPIRLHHKVQTLRLLKEELESPEQISLDEVILAVLCLATNEVETVAKNMNQKIRSPFNSPLTSAQWLDVYGSIIHIPAHTMAMRSLANRRGGLEMIELEGLAEILSFSDILGATQKLSRPYWPLLKRTATPRLQVTNPAIIKTGRGFQDLLSFGINDVAANVLQEMAELTTIIDRHCRGSHCIPNIAVLIDHRNNIQHHLLSLPKGDELTPGEVRSTSLYESIRLAAIIYSAAVTFPLPPLTGIFKKSSASLMAIIGESKHEEHRQPCPKILLWILVLGGIAASGTEHRVWYVKKLAAVPVALNFCQWDDVVVEMENWLWLRSACNEGGSSLWVEVMNERLRRGARIVERAGL